MSKKQDLTGQQFGKLTVVKYMGINKHKKRMWQCMCSCGSNNVVIASTSDLKSGNTNSCGCYQLEQLRKNSYKNKKYNTYDLSGDYGIGYTFKDEKFYFDLEDYNKIKDYCWHLSKMGYVASFINDKYIFMHDYLLNPKGEQYIDHIYQQKYDNRKSQLRLVNKSQNAMNSGIHINNTSGYTGVWWHKRMGKWQAQITVNYQRIFLGTFDNFEDAVNTRQEAEEKYFKEYKYKGDNYVC